MTLSTRLMSRWLVPLGGIALLLATAVPAYYQRREERLEVVSVTIEDAQKRIWDHVNITNDDDFIAKRYHPDDKSVTIQHNFRPGASWVMIDGFLLGYDPKGKSKNLSWRQRDRLCTDWKLEHAGRFSFRMCAEKGPLKGWWVGLEVIKEEPEPNKPARARLVLVKDKKDAVVFEHEDPTDISP